MKFHTSYISRLFLLFVLLSLGGAIQAQGKIVTTQPEFPTIDQSVTIVFDASLGTQGLKDYTGEVYAHTGVITDKSTSASDWKYAPAWGDNSEKYKMTALGNNQWELKITPNIRAYYGVDTNEKILRMAFVFRSKDKSKEGKDIGGKDIFVEVYENTDDLQVVFNQPTSPQTIQKGKELTFKATSSRPASLTLSVGGTVFAEAPNATTIEKAYLFKESGSFTVKATAKADHKEVSKSIVVSVVEDTSTEQLPKGARPGITYISDTEALLVLQAPKKKNVYVLGDFNDWTYAVAYQMKQDGEYFWLKIKGLEKEKEYAFQYVVDQSIRVADPYTEKVLDPWNDSYIGASVYPNLKKYPEGKTEGIVSVLQTGQTAYQWKASNYTKPASDQLITYELLIRDFTKEGTYTAAMQKLPYLKELGINAIELMPVNEFEGNDSWGYNPSFYFAPDKAYGTKEDLKRFIDACHANDIVVLFDLVLNHSFGQSPFYLLYRQADGKPSADNPWYNQESNMTNKDLQWGFDFNHESAYTRALVDSVASFWMKEYKVDGFRYDFTKGFSNTKPKDEWANTYDQARVDNLLRMSNEVWKRNPKAYVIFEHLAEQKEEKVLGEKGILLWRNMNDAYSQSAMGWSERSGFSGLYAGTSSMPAGSLMGYMESHDEERTSFKAKTWGNYDMKTNLATRMNQAQVNAAFFLTVPGPKMIWQMGELGYDISIDEGGRTGRKPVLWNYLEDTNRKALYDTYAGLSTLRKDHPELFASSADFKWTVGVNNWDNGRFISSVADGKALVVAGNFTNKTSSYTVTFPKTGTWENYFTGEKLEVDATTQTVSVPGNNFKLFVQIDKGAVSTENIASTDDWSAVGGVGYLYIQSAAARTLRIYDLNGILHKQLVVDEGHTDIALPQGVWIVNNKKVVVR